MAHKKITLETLAAQLTKLDARITEGFAKQGTEIKDLTESVAHVVEHMATKEDAAEIRRTMATKEQLIALHGQVNAIETNIRDMKHVKLHARVADLEEKIFGEARA
jgi:hypothetical protein